MTTRIIPTIGRVVHFYQSATFPEPRAAIITYVHNEGMVNLVTFDANGNPVPATSVPLHHEGDEVPNGFRAEWMPYQKGQAAKTEALEKQIAGA